MSRSSRIGQVLSGRYRIDEILGQGGMSAVYKAYDPNLKRVVAVKTIHTHLASDPRFLVRFEEEATAVAQLRHPNIVQVYDFNHDDDLYYMVQEFLPGETLQERLRRLNKAGRRLSLEEAVRFAIHICDAAGYAHRRGMIHRDIKPANIMLDVHDQAILMDFGIVKITGSDRHTATGAVVGTAVYMPPELIRGETPDPRSDLYSLGITLFEMVRGRPPFEADSAMTLMMMHVQDPVPNLRELRPGVPEDLIAIVEKSLAKDRDARFGSMAEMATALGKVLERLRGGTPVDATQLEQPAGAAAVAAGLKHARQARAERGRGGGAPGAADATDVEGRSAAADRTALEGMPAAVEPARARRFGGPAAPAESGPPADAQAAAAPEMEPAAALPMPRLADRPAVWIGAALLLVAIIAAVAFLAGRGSGDGKVAENQTPTVGAAQPTTTLAAVEPTLVPAAAPSATATARPTGAPSATPTNPPAAVPTQTPTPAPRVSPTPVIPAGVPFARIKGITVDNQQRYVVEYETFEFAEKLPGMHLHFFFNTVPVAEAGVPGEGNWTIYGGPRPFTGIKQSDRPADAGLMCVLVANPDHSVQLDSGTCAILPDVVTASPFEDAACRFGPGPEYPSVAQLPAWQVTLVRAIAPDETWWQVANPQALADSCWLPVDKTVVTGDISILPLGVVPPLPTGVESTELGVQITAITLDDQDRYAVEFEARGFTPQLPGTHIHFFFNNVAADQVGMTGGGLRRMHGGGSPFTGYAPIDRPAEASQLCALVANPDHSIVFDSGNCFPLPDVPQP